jgi:endonuclease YncB( thermonuclease family)
MLVGLFLFAIPAAAADIQVIDGGTLVVDGRTVRLWGIEAPAATQTCMTTTGRSWPCGKRVRDQLRSAVQEDAIVCQPKASGLELCRIAGLDIGALLVKEGLAKARDDYQELEARARSARVGLWE